MRFLRSKSLAIFVIALVLPSALGAFFYTYRIGERDILVERNVEITNTKDIEDKECATPKRRPMAVMIAEDEEARPLSGIAFADIVIEMPVVTGSITRMMAIFICEDPEEIGSIRSARHDFIPLALGYDAIFAHWGGSYIALAELKSGIIDNLDAMPNYFETFYRKKGIPAPHDGFTSMDRMINAAEKMGYRMTSNSLGYKFIKSQGINPKAKTLEVGYKYPYNVRYEYDFKTDSYSRWRGGFSEIDALTDRQVRVNNVVLMRAKSRQIQDGYNDVDILGGGAAMVYRNGQELPGTWVKEKADDALRFYDESGEEIAFATGRIWIEVVEPSTIVNYES